MGSVMVGPKVIPLRGIHCTFTDEENVKGENLMKIEF